MVINLITVGVYCVPFYRCTVHEIRETMVFLLRLYFRVAALRVHSCDIGCTYGGRVFT